MYCMHTCTRTVFENACTGGGVRGLAQSGRRAVAVEWDLRLGGAATGAGARRVLLACGGLERDGKLCGESGRRASARERRARRPAAAHLHRLMPDVRQILLIAPLRHLLLKFMRTSKNICTKYK